MSGPRCVLVTGATGFVGRAMVAQLQADGISVVAAVRHPGSGSAQGVREVVISDIGPATDWRPALAGVDAVIHLAARVHQMRETAPDPLLAFRSVNALGTAALARAAAASGVSRFVFVSSIKVNGEETAPGRPYTERDAPQPLDPYGVSKSEAETTLREIATTTGMPSVIVRPPLVYGPGVRANFLSMTRWVARGIPLPLGGVTENRRSLVALGNLVSLLRLTLEHPGAAGETFLVSDGDDVSTAELLRRTARALGRRALLIPVPTGALQAAAGVLGRREVAQRLCSSLQVDIGKARSVLGWRPPLTLDDGLRRAVEGLAR